MNKLLISLLVGLLLCSTTSCYALTAEELTSYVGKVIDIQFYVPLFLTYFHYETKGKILEVYEDELLGEMVKIIVINMMGEKEEAEIRAGLITYVSDGKTSVGEMVEE